MHDPSHAMTTLYTYPKRSGHNKIKLHIQCKKNHKYTICLQKLSKVNQFTHYKRGKPILVVKI